MKITEKIYMKNSSEKRAENASNSELILQNVSIK